MASNESPVVEEEDLHPGWEAVSCRRRLYTPRTRTSRQIEKVSKSISDLNNVLNKLHSKGETAEKRKLGLAKYKVDLKMATIESVKAMYTEYLRQKVVQLSKYNAETEFQTTTLESCTTPDKEGSTRSIFTTPKSSANSTPAPSPTSPKTELTESSDIMSATHNALPASTNADFAQKTSSSLVEGKDLIMAAFTTPTSKFSRVCTAKQMSTPEYSPPNQVSKCLSKGKSPIVSTLERYLTPTRNAETPRLRSPLAKPLT
ncbi:hypothetical protein EB796_002671 [Bugula neritina]|uniref:Uncharacterized protein n=1 Tax=Bugula neritina TaxID=10212 RepID=A0A7J7KLV0_BUGNE|nr:hypothetical protein EB796_002671 [Bugula neritina]